MRYWFLRPLVRCLAKDVSQERIEVNHVVWLWRETQDNHYQLLGREDKYVLPIVAIAIVHVLRHVGKLAAPVQPEEGTIAPVTGGRWLTCIVHPSFGKDSLVANTAVVEVHLSETCEIPCRGVEIR